MHLNWTERGMRKAGSNNSEEISKMSSLLMQRRCTDTVCITDILKTNQNTNVYS